MLRAGTVSGGGAWVEMTSLAREIENAMVSDGLVVLEDETPEATEQRRRTYAAMARGIVQHLLGHLDLAVQSGDLRASTEVGALPASALVLNVVGSQVTIAAGAIRAGGAAGAVVPPSARTLTGKVR